jgi:hypothetical protein
MRNIGGLELLVIFAVLGLIPAAVAARKGRSFLRWWIFGTFFWLVALVASLVVPTNRSGSKQCPACRSWIDQDATRCAHCTAEVPV